MVRTPDRGPWPHCAPRYRRSTLYQDRAAGQQRPLGREAVALPSNCKRRRSSTISNQKGLYSRPIVHSDTNRVCVHQDRGAGGEPAAATPNRKLHTITTTEIGCEPWSIPQYTSVANKWCLKAPTTRTPVPTTVSKRHAVT